jgi:AmmeMemoRadiSam system protein A
MAGTERLTLIQQKRLLAVAREAIATRLGRGTAAEVTEADPRLRAPRGAFVSIHLREHLRGCIGTLHPDQPLCDAVAHMAVAAATDDPRFPPLTSAELVASNLEVSTLGELQRIAPEDVVVGKHGLYLVQGKRRGVLLPQVPVQFRWSREEFLEETCRKAGLTKGAWKEPETVLYGFTAQVFSDTSVAEAEADAREPEEDEVDF